MKKPKITFDKAKLKSFFLLHGEKLGLGLFGLVFLWLIYSAITLETYEKTPEELDQAASRANQHIERQVFDSKTEGFVYADPDELVALSSERLDPAPFRVKHFNPPLWPASKRSEPEFLAVQDLVATAGFGTFRVEQKRDENAAAANNKGFKAYRWACITGLIPYEQQIAAYQQAMGREAPEPQYVFPAVQRAEVTSGDSAGLEWETLNFSAAMADQKRWQAQAAQEPIARDFLVPEPKPAFPMAFPLGPLVGRDWKLDEVVHPKLVEIVQANAAREEKPADEAAAADEPLDPEAMFRQQEEEKRNANKNKPADGKDKKPANVVPLRLFRYFDFTVEPGKRYRYRVALNLRNPNSGVTPHQLEDPKFAEGTYRRTTLSAPSPTVAIPFDSEILFGPFVKPRGTNEIAVRAIVTQRDSNGRTAIVEHELPRGVVGNFEATDARLEEPSGATATEGNHHRFRTDTLIVDIRAASDDPAGSIVVCLMPDGRLRVRSAEDDASRFSEYQQRLKPTTPATPGTPEDTKPAAVGQDLLSGGN